MHEESSSRHKVEDNVHEGAVPAYLLDHDDTTRAKFIATPLNRRGKRKLGNGRFLCQSKTMEEDARMVTKATFVVPGFTRKPPKYERFIRPSGLRFLKAHVTHLELKCTFCLEIIGVKKNPNGPMYTSVGVMARGTTIEVSLNFLT